jgi:ribulose-5-phosphate 4-epimerase/fuculose-1-phosphate aldolase
MSIDKWQARKELLPLFKAVGRVLLLNDMEDSHSGNIAAKWKDKDGSEYIVITSTGSQKGDLDLNQICQLSTTQTDFGYYKASSETDIHAGILAIEGVYASIHAHTKDLTIVTFDDEDKPNEPKPFYPIDPLGFYHLKGKIPVDWVAVPSGSPEMAGIIPDRLSSSPATVIQGHGTFTKGKNLYEALFIACIANHSGYIVSLAQKLGINIEGLREKIKTGTDNCFFYPSAEYPAYDLNVSDIQGEEEIIEEFRKTGARIFESRLSPFHTGSISVRGVKSLFYAPYGSMPREIGGPVLKLPISCEDSDTAELRMHKEIYQKSNFQTVIHCYVPEAEAFSHFTFPGDDHTVNRIVPIDAEGSFLYLVIPVVSPDVKSETLIGLLHDYKVVIIKGGGVWGVGAQSLSEVLHHPSSVREICLYLIGAVQRRLDIRKLQPKQAKRW